MSDLTNHLSPFSKQHHRGVCGKEKTDDKIRHQCHRAPIDGALLTIPKLLAIDLDSTSYHSNAANKERSIPVRTV